MTKSGHERHLWETKKGVGDVDSDARGSGARYNCDKPDYSMMPMHLFDEACMVWTYGAVKYKRWNWAKGMPWSVPFACICRHMFAWYRGERNDKESGLSHLAHVICNLMMLIHYERFFPEGDDRPTMFGKNHMPDIGDKTINDIIDPHETI